MVAVIEKPAILITSLGRTGTEFFARFFAGIIPNATALHEPDIFQNTGVESRIRAYFQQARRAGPWRMVVLKGLGKWTLVKLSDARFLGSLSAARSAHLLEAQRGSFVRSMPGSVYVEANIGYYGLLDVAPHVFQDHRAIFIVRDGRDWIRSHLNWGEMYGKRGLRRLISHNWPAANQVPGDPCAEDWHKFSRFEKLCWAWSRINEYALGCLSTNPDARVYHFEELFSGEQRYAVLEDLVGFATSLPGLRHAKLGSPKGWLERRSHQSTEGFPRWEDWTQEHKDRFRTMCRPLMEQLGYSI